MIEADELRSFVGGKGRTWWVWVAPDARTRQVVAMVAGDRTGASARRLGEALPEDYRAGAIVCTDFLAQYRAAVPATRHMAAGKDAGLTNHVERFWCTLRQRCSRPVRKALSFSKGPLNHVGAIWYFVRLYNASLL